MARILWHYAPGQYLPDMVSAGRLRTSNVGAPGEAPLLWFSANQTWEPTATKSVQTRRGLMRLTFAQQVARSGCIRFGLPSDDCRLLD